MTNIESVFGQNQPKKAEVTIKMHWQQPAAWNQSNGLNEKIHARLLQ